ncbi:MAG: thiamine diphosphokinase [Chloroflexota bacterium]|nr:thiamine diphosphokinase [Chloroflexota bacterium]
MLAFVAAGGELSQPQRFAPLARAADLVLAADSGYDHLLRMGVRPHLLLGDLDSISPPALEDARSGKTGIETFPTEKDYTDTELVLREAVGRGAVTVIACAAFGDRLDHTLANVLLLTSPALRDTDVCLLDERQEVRLVRRHIRLRTEPGETVSLLPVAGPVAGVATTGLYYPLSGATLETGPALGISNVATGLQIEVRHSSGFLLLTRIFKDGLDGGRYLKENPADGR